MSKEIKEQVVAVFSNNLCVPSEDVSLEKKMVEDLGMDSLDTVELVMELEDIFDITIEDEEIERCSTVEDIVKLVEKTVK